MDSAQKHVEEMLEQRLAFELIEEYIETRWDIGHGAQDALWLYAWVETDRAERRKAVGELIEGLRAGA